MTVSLIWAQASGGVIGKDGGIPWHLPEDLANFKALTTGHTVVMGRATWESLPERFRPLPHRRNLVLSRRPSWVAEGAERVDSLAAAIESSVGDLWVIGGGTVYAAAMPIAQRLVVTDVQLAVEGDTVAPPIGPEWRAVETTGWETSTNGVPYRVTTYTH